MANCFATGRLSRKDVQILTGICYDESQSRISSTTDTNEFQPV
jgi:hypothetical protein